MFQQQNNGAGSELCSDLRIIVLSLLDALSTATSALHNFLEMI